MLADSYSLRTITTPHNHETNFSGRTDLITHPMQPERPPAKVSTNVGTSPGGVAGCRVCGKSPDQVQFSNSQKKRLKKGKIATCKACASPADSSGSAEPSGVVDARPSPDGAKAITGPESPNAPITSVQVTQRNGWVDGSMFSLVMHIRAEMYIFA